MPISLDLRLKCGLNVGEGSKMVEWPIYNLRTHWLAVPIDVDDLMPTRGETAEELEDRRSKICVHEMGLC